jgi:pimeloyl-ACP methyl ester carboxylesterase
LVVGRISFVNRNSMTAAAAILLILLGAMAMWVLLSGPRLPPQTDAIIEQVLNGPLPNVVRGKTGFASSDGLKIWYESISPEGPPKGTVLLIMANGGDALIWPPKFIRAFTDAGYRVIRYDHRSTGMSDWIEHWDRGHPYSVADMAHDAAAVLGALEVPKAHVVGLSLGGMIAQELAIQRPDGVASLTLMLTSGDVGDPALPSMSTGDFLALMIRAIPLLMKYRIPGGEKNLIKERIAKMILTSGYEDLDIRETAEVVLYDLRKRRGINLKAAMQHQVAAGASGPRYEKLKTLDVPTLVIHGIADTIIPVEHGRKLAATIPHAKGLWLEEVGHVFPFPNMGEVEREIIANFERGQSRSGELPADALAVGAEGRHRTQ